MATDRRWDDRYYVMAYDAARAGEPDSRIADAIGVDKATLAAWRRKRPALEEAIAKGRRVVTSGDVLGYVYKTLPEHLKEVWNRIEGWRKEKNQVKKIEALLASHGKAARQSLFLHALVVTRFNVTEACRRVNVRRSKFREWVNEDPDFGELLNEVMEAKGDAIEAALFRGAVVDREPSLIKFASETINKARGYTRAVDVNVTGSVSHDHRVMVMKVDELQLEPDVLRKVLRAMQERRKAIPAESREVA